MQKICFRGKAGAFLNFFCEWIKKAVWCRRDRLFAEIWASQTVCHEWIKNRCGCRRSALWGKRSVLELYAVNEMKKATWVQKGPFFLRKSEASQKQFAVNEWKNQWRLQKSRFRRKAGSVIWKHCRVSEMKKRMRCGCRRSRFKWKEPFLSGKKWRKCLLGVKSSKTGSNCRIYYV